MIFLGWKRHHVVHAMTRIQQRRALLSAAIIILTGLSLQVAHGFVIDLRARKRWSQWNRRPPRPPPPPHAAAAGPRRQHDATSESRPTAAPFPAATPNGNDWPQRIVAEIGEIGASAGLALQSMLPTQNSVTVNDVVAVCDDLDAWQADPAMWTSETLQLRKKALEFQRYQLLVKLLSNNYDAYVQTATFLSNRIPRLDLPNLQDIPYDPAVMPTIRPSSAHGDILVADCELPELQYPESWLDKLLLRMFRHLVAHHTGGVTSAQAGMEGLLEQGRTFMLQPNQTAEAQHVMVQNTLADLMTPALPPFYRVFMAGIVPRKLGTRYDGKQFGPWFYAPWLTSVVTPIFFAFLVGPSHVNRRKDGHRGGLVVEKCKFLQQSNCKGLCLHQCKLPAQQFFADMLGLPLTVSPNFVTQECQWSFGETPVPPRDDPSFPRGCLVGCPSRSFLTERRPAGADICN